MIDPKVLNLPTLLSLVRKFPSEALYYLLRDMVFSVLVRGHGIFRPYRKRSSAPMTIAFRYFVIHSSDNYGS